MASPSADNLRAEATRAYQAYLRADAAATSAEWSEWERQRRTNACPTCHAAKQHCICL